MFLQLLCVVHVKNVQIFTAFGGWLRSGSGRLWSGRSGRFLWHSYMWFPQHWWKQSAELVPLQVCEQINIQNFNFAIIYNKCLTVDCSRKHWQPDCGTIKFYLMFCPKNIYKTIFTHVYYRFLILCKYLTEWFNCFSIKLQEYKMMNARYLSYM